MHPKFKPDSIENFKWEEYEDGIHIIDYCGYLFHVCIPETIHGKPVIALSGEYDSVYIPACVKYIRNFVFQNFQYTDHKPDYIIEIDPANPYLRWENGYLYDFGGLGGMTGGSGMGGSGMGGGSGAGGMRTNTGF